MIEWELGILDWVQGALRTPAGDAMMVGITHLGDKGLIWIVLAAMLLAQAKTRRQGAAVAAALVLVLLCCNLTLKPLVARTRPCDVNAAVRLLIARPADYSFPSGHTASSFAAVGALWSCRWRYRQWAAVLAVLIAFSRLYLYVHFPTDVLAGAALGLGLGVAAGTAAKRLRTA